MSTQLRVRPAGDGERERCLELWRASNEARGRVPPPARIARVRSKLADPRDLLLVAIAGGALRGMALAECQRSEDGAGTPEPGAGHVAMVFTAAGHWGQGVGTLMVQGLHAHGHARGWQRWSVWTGAENGRALALYRSCGYRLSGRRQNGPYGLIVQLIRG